MSSIAKAIESIPSRVKHAKQIHADIGGLLSRYHGGMPIGFLCAIAQWESGGKMSTQGDPVLGEVGIYQIEKSFPPKIGLPPDSRYDKTINVFMGCLEYQIEAVRSHIQNRAIRLGSADIWKFARLSFAIGGPGTRQLMQRSGAHTYPQIKNYIDKHPTPLGRQSAELVRFRVHAVDIQWAIGAQVMAPFYGPPEKIPSPPGVSYNMPKDVAPYMGSPLLAGLTIGSMGFLALLV